MYKFLVVDVVFITERLLHICTEAKCISLAINWRRGW